MKVITAENLTKKFGKFVAVENISFEVEEGEIVENDKNKDETIKKEQSNKINEWLSLIC